MTLFGRPLALWLVIAVSGGALLAALFFQYVVGLAPCKLCYTQRYAHGAVLAAAALALLVPVRAMAWLGALAGVASVGIAAYHSGIERKWWPGPASCTGGGGEDLSALSGSDLLAVDTAPPLVQCDQISWELFGLTMANYNVALSAAIVLLFVLAARRR